MRVLSPGRAIRALVKVRAPITIGFLVLMVCGFGSPPYAQMDDAGKDSAAHPAGPALTGGVQTALPDATTIPGDAEGRFRKAGEDYEAGRYEQAAAHYQQLLDEGYDDPRIHYNLGNTRFKQGRLGPAILCYERALARNPSDADARENLAYANLLTTDKVGTLEEDFPAQLLGTLEQRFGPNRAEWVCVILCVIAACLGIPIWLTTSLVLRKLLAVGAGISLAVAILAGGVAALEIAGTGHEAYAVVLASSTDGRSSPASDGTVLFTVHEGLKVEVRGERSGWIQVALPNGLAGWIESTHAARI